MPKGSMKTEKDILIYIERIPIILIHAVKAVVNSLSTELDTLSLINKAESAILHKFVHRSKVGA